MSEMPMFHRVLCCAMTLCLLATLPAAAESRRNTQPTASAVRAEIDLEAMLHTRYMLEGVAEGRVWRFEAAPGKRLVKIPVTFMPGTTDYRVGMTDLSIGTGRLIAWQLAETVMPASADAYAPRPSREVTSALPSGAPVFTRDFTVRRDGRLAYRLDYRLPGGRVIADAANPYCLKLDRAMAEAARPVEPNARLQAGETPADHASRVAREAAAYRTAAEAYRQAIAASRDLVTDFVTPLPSRVWAICEINALQSRLRITLPGQEPWELAADDVQTLWALKRPAGRATSLAQLNVTPAYYRPLLENARDIVVDRPSHPYTSRLIASALASAGIVQYVGTGDAQHQLLVQLLADQDPLTHRILGEQLDRVAGLAMSSELMQLRLQHPLAAGSSTAPAIAGQPLEQLTQALNIEPYAPANWFGVMLWDNVPQQ